MNFCSYILTGFVCLTMTGGAVAQQVRDNLDVIDGPNPTLRYGFYTDPDGSIQMGRYYFIDDGESLGVSLVPFGKTVTELPVKHFDRQAGELRLGWEGKPGRVCKLNRNGRDLYLGNCTEGEDIMPIAIRAANEFDAEWMGSHLAVSETDVAIVDEAIRILSEQDSRNPGGDRNCDDDIAAHHFSIFCALYVASVKVAGVYRHRRPALRIARDQLIGDFPGDYAHMLRDINNRAEISDGALIASLRAARERLLHELPHPP